MDCNTRLSELSTPSSEAKAVRRTRRIFAAEAAAVHIAAKQLEPSVDEEASELLRRMLDLEERGLVKWNDSNRTWRLKASKRRTAPKLPAPCAPSRRSISEADLLQRFDKVRETGRGWVGRCPAHQDRTPSLSIARGHTRWLLKCFAGCDIAQVAGAAGLQVSDLRVGDR